MTFGATNAPGTCLWCGRKLRRVAHTTWERTDKRPRRCSHKGYGFEPVPCASKTFTNQDGGWICGEGHAVSSRKRVKERTFPFEKPGYQGNGFFCTQGHAYMFAVSAARSGIVLSRPKGK